MRSSMATTGDAFSGSKTSHEMEAPFGLQRIPVWMISPGEKSILRCQLFGLLSEG